MPELQFGSNHPTPGVPNRKQPPPITRSREGCANWFGVVRVGAEVGRNEEVASLQRVWGYERRCRPGAIVPVLQRTAWGPGDPSRALFPFTILISFDSK